jgi:hypothetical protein
MPREWRFTGRFAAWRKKCATAERARFLSAVADALVDRRSIDWAALRGRIHTCAGRSAAENLRLLERIRDGAAAAAPHDPAGDRIPSAVRLLVAVSTLQTVCSLIAIALAWQADRTSAGHVSQVLLAVSFAAAAALVATASGTDRRSVFLAAVFCATASAFARPVVEALESPVPTLTPILRGIYPEAFVPGCLWRLAQDFPCMPRFNTVDEVTRRMTAAAWILGAVLFLVNLGGAYGVTLGPSVLLARDHPANLFWSLFSIAAVPAVLTILLRARRADPTERRKISRFAHAFALGCAPLLLCGVARLFLPAFDDWMRAAPERWLDRFILLALLTTPTIGTIALVVDRPFELRALTRSALFNALERRGIVRGADHRERLVSALERVRTARGARGIAAVLVRELHQAIGDCVVRLLVPSPDGAFVDPSTGGEPLANDAILPALMRDTMTPLDVSAESRLRALLPTQDRSWLTANGTSLAAPVIRRDGRLAAIVAVGARPDGRAPTRRDRWLVVTLTTAAAAAWDADASSAMWDEQPALECPRCGVVSDSQPLPCGCAAHPIVAALPRHLSAKFVVERRIGAGGMGVVYLAHDSALNRHVAAKTLPTLGSGAVARLRGEARTMAALNHESLATIYGLEIWRGVPVLIVEHCPGGTLADRLRAGPLAVDEAIRLGVRLAQALSYMHAKGILHRDIKPSNIGFTAAGSAKLLDFGLVGAGDRIAGTPAYMPPEALEGAAASPAFDLWALALVLREAAGENSGRSGTLQATLERALAVHPEQRFLTAGDLLAALVDSSPRV